MNWIDRFWAKVTKTDACWEWATTGRNRQGYGQLKINGRQHSAHRLSFLLHYGPIHRGLVVRHTCDNPACVRPDHLIPGTYADNMRDAVERGRIARGTRHGRARITYEIAEQIRAASTGGMRQRAIAAQFGVAQTTVSQIVRGVTWAEVA